MKDFIKGRLEVTLRIVQSHVMVYAGPQSVVNAATLVITSVY